MSLPSAAATQPWLLSLEDLPLPVACFERGGDPRLLAVNAHFRACFALPDGELPTLSQWLALTYPLAEYRQRVIEQWGRAADEAGGGTIGSLQCRLVSLMGEQLEVLLQISDRGEHLVVAFQDVTARSRAEAELEEARTSLAQTALAITEAIPVGTYTMVMPPDRPVAYFSFLSERFLELTGLDRARARQNPLEGFACVHPDDYDDWLRLNAEAFARKQPFRGQCRVLLNGETRWITAESVPRDLPDGSTVWEGVLIDITEEMQARQQLQESEERLQRLLDNLPIPVATAGTAPGRAPVFCNRRFSETFGYQQSELADLPTWMAQAYPDPVYRAEVECRWNAALDEATRTGQTVSAGEFTVRCADGRVLDVLISAAHIDDLVAATLVDISERKRSERMLFEAREREKQLEEQQRLRLEQKLRTSLTAAAVAHEINQPLSTILLQAKLALQHLAPADDQVASSCDVVELRQLLGSLVGDAEQVVQVMSKMRSLLRNVQTEPQLVDLATVVDSALLFRQPHLLASGVTLRCQGLESPCLIAGDADQLQVAVSNLLRNALDALEAVPAGQRRLEVVLEQQENRVTVCVDDSGSGFQPGVLEALPLATTKPDGTGLGLYVVRTTADNHGGDLSIGRSPLGGARVSLTLPALPATLSPPDACPDAPPGGALTEASLTVASPAAAPSPDKPGSGAELRLPPPSAPETVLQPQGQTRTWPAAAPGPASASPTIPPP